MRLHTNVFNSEFCEKRVKYCCMHDYVIARFAPKTKISFQQDVIYSSLLYDYRQLGVILPEKGYLNIKEGLSEYLICVCKKGALYALLNGEKQILSEGQMMFLDMYNHFELSAKDEDNLLYFGYFRGSNINDFYKRYLKYNNIISNIKPDLENKFLNLINYVNDGNNNKKEISSLIYELLLTTIVENKEDIQLKNALNYIENNYQYKINIPYLAKLCYFSNYYFHHKFKEKLYQTPLEYINNYRFKKAIHLLTNTNKNIDEIAEEVGFSSKKIFVKMCRKYLGNSPSKYRKSIKR